MFFNRAISNGVRTYCPDVLGNAPVYDPDELGASTDELGRVTELPANAIPAVVEEPAPKEPEDTPPADDEPSDDQPEQGTEKPAITESPLLAISNYLASKGITEKEDRGKITLRVGSVQSFSDKNTREWSEVFDQIKTMDKETLETFLDDIEEDEPAADPKPPVTPDPVVDVDAGFVGVEV